MWQECSFAWSNQVLLLFVPIGYPTWLPRAIKASDLTEIFNDLLHRYYMEDGIENCHEWNKK
jgi:hypothetical protein